MALSIYYDGDCPLCSRYVRLLRLRDTFGELRLVDVREDSSARKTLKARGITLDEGMAVDIDGTWYEGSDAVHALAALSTPSTAFNRINRLLFASRRSSGLLYPLMRGGRNILLFLLGRQRLEPESDDALAPLHLFNVAWGFFAILHVIAYAWFFKPGEPLRASTWLIALFGAGLMFRPRSGHLFLALLFAFCVDAWLQMPVQSNHTIIKNFLLLGMCAAGARQWLKGGKWSDVYADFAPLGRVLLVVMYVFGVFHKINSDFLDPSVSCAVALWRQMPAPLSYIDNPAMHQLAIYGTFLVEGAILLCLLLRRTRALGIGLGIGFHSLLALSGYAMYVQFSMLTVTLHILFIERFSAAAILSSPFWARLQTALTSPLGILGLAVWVTLFSVLAWNGSFSQTALIWLPGVLAFAWAVIYHGHSDAPPSPARSLLVSRSWLVNLLSVLFFLNCVTPYLGLKNAQSINMFANLRLEAGVSNHLVLKTPPAPFGYLEDLVSIRESSGSAYLAYISNERLYMTYYHLLDHLERNPGASVTFERRGAVLANQSAASLHEEIERVLHPRWFRNWFHFAPADLSQPKPCALDR